MKEILTETRPHNATQPTLQPRSLQPRSLQLRSLQLRSITIVFPSTNYLPRNPPRDPTPYISTSTRQPNSHRLPIKHPTALSPLQSLPCNPPSQQANPQRSHAHSLFKPLSLPRCHRTIPSTNRLRKCSPPSQHLHPLP